MVGRVGPNGSAARPISWSLPQALLERLRSIQRASCSLGWHFRSAFRRSAF